MLSAPSAERIRILLLEPDAPLSRAGDATILPATLLATFITLILHASPRTGSIGTPRTGLAETVPTTQRQSGHEDPRMEFTQKLGAEAGAVALSIGAAADAQDAVQWRTEDGGNGHWCARNQTGRILADAGSAAGMRGGQLATTTPAGELAFLRTRLIHDGVPCWLAGKIDCSAVGSACCEGCIWRWTTGEPFDVAWTGWVGDNGFTTERLVTNGIGFDDMCSPCSVHDYRPPSIIEWSADCNSDGTVDASDLALVLGSWGDCP